MIRLDDTDQKIAGEPPGRTRLTLSGAVDFSGQRNKSVRVGGDGIDKAARAACS
jgi:hypothetical protein